MKQNTHTFLFFVLSILFSQRTIRAIEIQNTTMMGNATMTASEIQYLNAITQLGNSFEKKGDYEKALQYYNNAFEIDPTNAEVNFALGKTLKQTGNIDQAIKHYELALKKNPKNVEVLIEIANIFNALEEPKNALALYLKAFEINPNLITLQYNIGFTLKKLGYIDKAISIYQKILHQKPDYALAHFSLALAYLSIGDFQHGWQEYQWRWKALNEKPKTFTKPVWNGCDLTGKTIYIYAEQSLENTFQFIRYLKLIKARGATIIFETQTPLVNILSLCPYIDSIVVKKDDVPEFDYHIPIMSLPLIFNTQLETIPSDTPYLYADPTIEKFWQKTLSCDRNFKIGICWRGNAHEKKWIPFNALEQLCKLENVSVYSLQKIDKIEQLKNSDCSIVINKINNNTSDNIKKIKSECGVLHTFGSDFDESNGHFMDTAAIIKNLDLVISVDSAVGHLAGGLGVPVWLMLPAQPDWKWFVDRTDSPWYPTMHLFLQEKIGDWDPVINKIIETLSAIVDTKKMPASLSAQNLIDQMTRYEIEKKETNDLKYTHNAAYNHDSLQTIYRKYVEKNPLLTSYTSQLTEVNQQLKTIENKLKLCEISTFNPEYIDLAKKACYAHDIKQDLKNKIQLLQQNN